MADAAVGPALLASHVLAQGETIAAATGAGTPTALGLQRFGHFNGTVKRAAPRWEMWSRPRSYIPTILTGSRSSGAMAFCTVPS
jgi:hypothetical protein